MSYEIKLLKTAARYSIHKQLLHGQALRLALSSFDATTTSGMTYSQLCRVSRYMQLSAILKQNYHNVTTALNGIDKGYKALLIAFYCKNVTTLQLSRRYKVARTTIYRKLRYAKQNLAYQLQSLGVDDQWYSQWLCPKIKELASRDLYNVIVDC